MSTFDGIIKEYPLISIDSFLPNKNYSSTAYFLSHCHADHMYGLADKNFFKHLKSRNFSKIYLCDVSSHLLKNDSKYQHLDDYLVGLPMEQPTIIVLYDEDGKLHSRVVVTLLTAGHCPGSVMFLIEGENGRVLYTGDFRLPIGSAARMTHMHEDDGSLKLLQSLYIDTTFCNKKCLFIPSREECLSEIVSLIEPWIFKGPSYIVCFYCPAQYAYEFVFVELYKRFGVKTHVTAEKEKKYIGIKRIEDAVTSYAPEARIHACVFEDNDIFESDFYKEQTPCGYFSPDKKPVRIRKIKPSAMFFQKQDFTDISQYDYRTKMYRVCYSTHSSLSEIRDMVSYLKPKEVFPNVVRKQTEKEILDLIYEIEAPSSPETKSEDITSPLGQLNSPQIKEFSNGDDSLPFYDQCYEISKGKKNSAELSKYRSGICENLCIETDFENTEEQEVMLKEEIYSHQKKISENLKSVHKQSPLKWQNPILSSDDDVSEHSSTFESPIKDKLNSAMDCGTSKENKPMSVNKEIPVSFQTSAHEAIIPVHTAVISSTLVSKSDNLITNSAQYVKDNSLKFSLESNHKSSSNLISESQIFPSTSRQYFMGKKFKRQSRSNAKNCSSKSFNFVKRINCSGHSSEEDDEKTFKHVVKLNKSDSSSSDSDGEYAFQNIIKLPKQHKKNIRPTVNAVTNKNINSNHMLSFQESDKYPSKSNNHMDHFSNTNVIKQNNVTKTDLVNSKLEGSSSMKEIKISYQNEIINSESQCQKISEKNISVNRDLKHNELVSSKESKFSSCKLEKDSESHTVSSRSHVWVIKNVTTNLKQTMASEKSKLSNHKLENTELQTSEYSHTYATKNVTDLNQSLILKESNVFSHKPENTVLQTASNNSHANTTENLIKLNEPECSKTKNIFEELFLISSDEMIVPCSPDQSLSLENKVHSSINCYGDKIFASDAHNSAVESVASSILKTSNKEMCSVNGDVRSNHPLRTNVKNPLVMNSDERSVPFCENMNLSQRNNAYSSSNKYRESEVYLNNSHESVTEFVDLSISEFSNSKMLGRNNNVRINHQVKPDELNVSKCISENASNLQTIPSHNYTDKNKSTKLSQPQEFSKSQDIFEEILCPSSDEIISSASCSNNLNFTQVNKTCSSTNKSSVCEVSANNVQIPDAECIDLASDSSNEEICFLESTLPTASKISTNIEIKSKNADECSVKSEKSLLTDIDFPKYTSKDLKFPTSNKHNLFETCQQLSLQRIPEIIVSGNECNDSFCNNKPSTCPRENATTSSKVYKETSISGINKMYAISESIGTWEATSVNQVANSNVVVEDDSLSDLDDSPSLIAPILKVFKLTETENSSHFSNKANFNSKKRKIGCRNHFSFTECSDSLVNNHDICDKHLKGSDSTPEDLIENCNLLANKNLPPKKKIPEIIIDEDS